MAAEAGIPCRPVGVQAPNQMSVCERYYTPLRKNFEKLEITYGLPPLEEEVEVRPVPRRPRKSVHKGYKNIRMLTVNDEYLLLISVMCINSYFSNTP